MSDQTAHDLLETANTVVNEYLTRMRTLVVQANQRAATLDSELRQIERALDEAAIQRRFAADQRRPVTGSLAEREHSLRADHERLGKEQERLKRTLKQLDQLIRQIDMSSSTLGVENEHSDPWVQALRSQIILGREDERARLAREVHDGPAQVLANALMGMERCRTLLEASELEKLNVMIDRLSTNCREGLTEVRSFIADLRPGQLEERGLVAALVEYLSRYRQAINDRVTFEADKLPRLPAEHEIVLYRVVQEALQNANKHARGAAIHIQLVARDGRVRLSIRDEGPGFDPRQVARRAGRESWGLTSMRERAELVGGKLTVGSRPGQGTDVVFLLPLQPQGGTP